MISNFFKNGRLRIFIFFLLILPLSPLFAQEKCGTVLYNQIRQERYPQLETEQKFEIFISRKLQEKNLRQGRNGERTAQENVLEIPVVIHIIHKGEPIGTGVNLSDNRILSQINTLNTDYRRLNSDTIFTPPQYLDVAADTEIEFVLARSDPEGMPTNGIVRVRGSQDDWGINDNEELKAESYWPAENYLNIWVTDLSSELLGFAQFPVSDLQGLEFSFNNRLTDGVVIDYEYFGENININPRSMGRTTTHEIGHFLGLRHTWGDGNCDVDDYCDDTPNSRGPNYTCTSERISCDSRDMFENYMDYTNDVCMNIFTQCQKARMRTVLTNSPRRESLTNSPGLEDPVLVANDAGIKEIVSPQVSSCESLIIPEIEVRNYGINNITSLEIGLFLDGNLIETVQENINLPPQALTNIPFSPLNFTEKGPYFIQFEILSTNQGPDNNPFNNIKSRTFYIRTEGELPLAVDFEEFPDDWLVLNPDNSITWEVTTIPATNTTAAVLNFHRYNHGIGQLDYLLSPSFDFRDLVTATLSFRVAYTTFPDVDNDGLSVIISKDCGNNFPDADVIYRKYGRELATAPPSEASFVPSVRSDWRIETIDLSNYIGDPNIQIGFISQNGYGNNLFISDLEIFIKRRVENDISLIAITGPSEVSCENHPAPQLLIENQGRTSIQQFTVSSSINGNPLPIFPYAGPPINPGERITLDLPPVNLLDGAHNFTVELQNPNGAADDFPEDNAAGLNFVIDNTQDILPLREDFNALNTLNDSQWTVANPDGGITWELAVPESPEDGQAVFRRNFVDESIGQKDWLVSPVLNMIGLQEASLFFSVAHAYNRNYPDGLEILVSLDCGITYSDTIYAKYGEELATASSTQEWFPEESADYRREFLDLTQYVGEENLRIAFIATNGYGNNIFLDDIEFFVSADPDPVAGPENNFILYPNPASEDIRATFNLSQRENVYISLFDNIGRLMFRSEFPNTLNQTYHFDLGGISSGVYLLRIQGERFNNTKRIIIH
ncbi:hypothetical protein BH23BAC1_BH23BAC1_43020 [soil metagenome]